MDFSLQSDVQRCGCPKRCSKSLSESDVYTNLRFYRCEPVNSQQSPPNFGLRCRFLVVGMKIAFYANSAFPRRTRRMSGDIRGQMSVLPGLPVYWLLLAPFLEPVATSLVILNLSPSRLVITN